MYAVITSGGKQYRVKEGQVITVEKIELEPGAPVEFEQVLLVGEGDNVQVGLPYVDGCKVTALVESHGRADKVKIVKFNRRKHHMKQMGHRQWFTKLKITGISAASAA